MFKITIVEHVLSVECSLNALMVHQLHAVGTLCRKPNGIAARGEVVKSTCFTQLQTFSN